MIIYQITNQINGKKYIGQTIGTLASRWIQHKCTAKTGRISALCSAIRKYGVDNFEMILLDDTANTIDELNVLEQIYIETKRTLSPNGYNLRGGGNNHVMSEESKLKLSMVKTGHKQSAATKRKRSLAMKGKLPWNTGKRLTDEQKKNYKTRATAWKGKHLSQETRQKLRDANLGKEASLETRRKMSETHKRIGNKPPSALGRVATQETREKNRRRMLLIWKVRKANGFKFA